MSLRGHGRAAGATGLDSDGWIENHDDTCTWQWKSQRVEQSEASESDHDANSRHQESCRPSEEPGAQRAYQVQPGTRAQESETPAPASTANTPQRQ